MRKWSQLFLANIDLALALAVILCLALTATADTLIVVRRIAALLTILFIPGYVLLAALTPKPDDLTRAERLTGSIAASLALTILIGVVLNTTFVGIGFYAFVGAVFALVASSALIACLRRWRHTGASGQSQMSPLSSFDPSLNHPARLLAGIGVLVTVICGVYYVALFPPEQPTFQTTLFYLEPVEGGLEDLGVRGEAEQPIAVNLGLANNEQQAMQYEVVQHMQGERDRHIATVELAPGKEWEMRHELRVPKLMADRRVSFFVYRGGETETPYRTVYLWLRQQHDSP